MMGNIRLAWIGIGATAALWALAGPASAITALTLVGPIAGNTVGPQSTSNPCIIAGTQCQQPVDVTNPPNKFPFTNFNQNENTVDEVSPTYTVNQLIANVGALFNVAIDVNTTSAATETLNVFTVTDTTTGTVLFDYPTPPAPTNIANINNQGNGFADWTLNTVNLTGLALTDNIVFHVNLTGAVDGAESFFLISVPGPLAGAGLPGLVAACGGLLALARRRRRLVA